MQIKKNLKTKTKNEKIPERKWYRSSDDGSV